MNLGWHSNIPPYRVEMRGEEVLERLGLEPKWPSWRRIDVFLWRTDLDGVYVVCVHVVDKHRRLLSYYPGCGAGVSFDEALERAFTEAGQAYQFIYVFQEWAESPAYRKIFEISEDARPEEIDNLFKTVYYYGYPVNLAKLYEEFFSRAPRVPPPGEGVVERLSHRLSIVRAVASEKGLRPLAIDHTPPGMTEGVVLRVFVPELVQYNAPRYPMLGHPRYYDARRILGVGGERLSYRDLRKKPTPYP